VPQLWRRRPSYNCPKRNKEVPAQEGGGVEKEKTERGIVRCYSCGKRGHMVMHCPNKALFCGEQCGGAATWKRKVEGREVEDIVLDTGCLRTMVKWGLVPEGCWKERQ